MGRIRLKLVSGKEYLFTHKRLKTVKVRYMGIVRAPGSDPSDEYYLECSVADLDRSVRPPSLRETDRIMLRPSMITLVQDVPANYSPPVTEFASPLRIERGRQKRRIAGKMRSIIRTFIRI